MRVLARGIEDARNVTIEGPEGRDPRELDRAIIFSRASYQLSRRQDGRHAAFRCGDGIDEMHDSLRRDSSFTPPGSSIGWAISRSHTLPSEFLADEWVFGHRADRQRVRAGICH
jgi:hypothetical protein